MSRRAVAAVVAVGLVASALAGAAGAQPATQVPASVQIEDPLNDANFLNDQDFFVSGVCSPPCQGDHTTPADAGSVSDFIKVWFSNDATTFSVHMQTQAPPPAISTIRYGIQTNPGEGAEGSDVRGCLHIRAIFGGRAQGQNVSTYRGDDFAEIIDFCNVGPQPVDGEVKVEEGPDGTGITTFTFPRTASPLLADGSTITGPYAISRVAAGTDRNNWRSTAQSDNTKRGSDYVIQSAQEPPKKKKKKKKGGRRHPDHAPSSQVAVSSIDPRWLA